MINRYEGVYMNKSQFFHYSLENGYLTKMDWYKSVFAIPQSDNLIVKKSGDTFTVDGLVIDSKSDRPIFKVDDKITVDKGVFKSRDEMFTDTIGRILINYLIIEFALNGNGDYFKGEINRSILDSYILERFKDDTYSVEDIIRLGNTFKFIRSLANLVVIPLTKKSYDPPKWLSSEKRKIANKYEKQYGKRWLEDKALVTKYEDEVMEKVKEYYKDDPTYGITMDKKAMKSFKKKFISIGNNESLTNNTKPIAVLNSLEEEYPKDKEAIASIINSVIYGSGSRALATIDAGVITKRLLTAVHGFKITIEDCKSRDGYPITVTEFYRDSLKEFYAIVNGKLVSIDDKFIDKHMGKEIVIRNVIYCKAKGEQFCKICSGKSVGLNENAITLLTSKVGGDGLNYQLSKFHGSNYEIKEFTLEDITG